MSADQQDLDQHAGESGGPPRPPAQPKKRHRARTILGVALTVFVVLIGVAACGATDDSTKEASADTSVSAPAPTEDPGDITWDEPTPTATEDPGDITWDEPTPDPTTSAPARPKSKPKPKLTPSQEQAIGSAEDYLSFMAFSRRGLIRQLSSEYGAGFSKADATFAVNHIHVNWNEQAAKSAKEYLDTMHFSRSGLIRQLESEYGAQFTHAQAVYGVDKAGL